VGGKDEEGNDLKDIVILNQRVEAVELTINLTLTISWGKACVEGPLRGLLCLLFIAMTQFSRLFIASRSDAWKGQKFRAEIFCSSPYPISKLSAEDLFLGKWNKKQKHQRKASSNLLQNPDFFADFAECSPVKAFHNADSFNKPHSVLFQSKINIWNLKLPVDNVDKKSWKTGRKVLLNHRNRKEDVIHT
jgi:hypothetical protein